MSIHVVILEPSGEGGYTVYVPSLPGCISEGETWQEALDNIQEAMALHLESLEGLSPDANAPLFPY